MPFRDVVWDVKNVPCWKPCFWHMLGTQGAGMWMWVLRTLEVWEAQPSAAGHRATRLGATGCASQLIQKLFQWAALEQLFKDHGQAHNSSCPPTTGWGQCPHPDPDRSLHPPQPSTEPLPPGRPPCFPGRGVLTPFSGPTIPGYLH